MLQSRQAADAIRRDRESHILSRPVSTHAFARSKASRDNVPACALPTSRAATSIESTGYGRYCIFLMAELALPRYLFRRILERWPTMFNRATSHD